MLSNNCCCYYKIVKDKVILTDIIPKHFTDERILISRHKFVLLLTL